MVTVRNVHFFASWAKERLGEMDAAIASLKRQAKRTHEREKTKRLLADLKRRRGRFNNFAMEHFDVGQGAWHRSKSRLELQWKHFEADFNSFIRTAKRQSGFHQSTFQKLAVAQTKAWRQAASKLRVLNRKVGPARRKDLATALKQMKTDASNAQARLKRLEAAGAASWSAMRAALNVSRREFDRASRRAGRAIRRAMK